MNKEKLLKGRSKLKSLFKRIGAWCNAKHRSILVKLSGIPYDPNESDLVECDRIIAILQKFYIFVMKVTAKILCALRKLFYTLYEELLNTLNKKSQSISICNVRLGTMIDNCFDLDRLNKELSKVFALFESAYYGRTDSYANYELIKLCVNTIKGGYSPFEIAKKASFEVESIISGYLNYYNFSQFNAKDFVTVTFYEGTSNLLIYVAYNSKGFDEIKRIESKFSESQKSKKVEMLSEKYGDLDGK